jgi:hypothetical protein
MSSMSAGRFVRRPLEGLRPVRAGSSQLRKVGIAEKQLATALQPVVHERGLELRDDGPGDAEMRIAPMVWSVRISEPEIGDAGTARESDASVDDQYLAVRALLDLCDRAPPSRVVPRQLVVEAQLDAGILHPLLELPVDAQAPEPVDHHVGGHAGPCALGERLRELLADSTLPVHERLEGDRPPRAADRGEHRREDLVAVPQRLHAVAVLDLRAEQAADGAPELHAAHRIGPLDLEVRIARTQHRDVPDDRPGTAPQASQGQREDAEHPVIAVRSHRSIVLIAAYAFRPAEASEAEQACDDEQAGAGLGDIREPEATVGARVDPETAGSETGGEFLDESGSVRTSANEAGPWSATRVVERIGPLP